MSEPSRDFGGIDENIWAELERTARNARDHAYVPYSEFPVGAAVLTPAGEIFAGCNVENATIGATVCAERTAIGCAVTAGAREVSALCVVTDVRPPAAPCGICRQVIAEFADELPIMMVHPDGEHRFSTLSELLPLRFSGRDFTDDRP